MSGNPENRLVSRRAVLFGLGGGLAGLVLEAATPRIVTVIANQTAYAASKNPLTRKDLFNAKAGCNDNGSTDCQNPSDKPNPSQSNPLAPGCNSILIPVLDAGVGGAIGRFLDKRKPQ